MKPLLERVLLRREILRAQGLAGGQPAIRNPALSWVASRFRSRNYQVLSNPVDHSADVDSYRFSDQNPKTGFFGDAVSGCQVVSQPFRNVSGAGPGDNS